MKFPRLLKRRSLSASNLIFLREKTKRRGKKGEEEEEEKEERRRWGGERGCFKKPGSFQHKPGLPPTQFARSSGEKRRDVCNRFFVHQFRFVSAISNLLCFPAKASLRKREKETNFFLHFLLNFYAIYTGIGKSLFFLAVFQSSKPVPQARRLRFSLPLFKSMLFFFNLF